MNAPAARLAPPRPAAAGAPLRFRRHPDRYAVAHLPPDAPPPTWATGAFVSVTRTPDELSIVAPAGAMPADVSAEGPFALLELEGPFPLDMVGVLARVAGALSGARVPVLCVGTFRTDFLLVPYARARKAARALIAAGLAETAWALPVRYGVFETPFGRLLAAQTPQGLAWAALGDDPAALEADVQRAFPEAALTRDEAALAPARVALLAALSGAPVKVPLDLRGTPFQRHIWRVLAAIPAGETATYAEVAERAGLPASAARVVAQAVAANPVALAVPCHRVVRSDARNTDFRWGAARKMALLLFERQGQLSLFEPAPL